MDKSLTIYITLFDDLSRLVCVFGWWSFGTFYSVICSPWTFLEDTSEISINSHSFLCGKHFIDPLRSVPCFRNTFIWSPHRHNFTTNQFSSIHSYPHHIQSNIICFSFCSIFKFEKKCEIILLFDFILQPCHISTRHTHIELFQLITPYREWISNYYDYYY